MVFLISVNSNDVAPCCALTQSEALKYQLAALNYYNNKLLIVLTNNGARVDLLLASVIRRVRSMFIVRKTTSDKRPHCTRLKIYKK